MPTVTVRVSTTGDIHKVNINPERLRIPNGSRRVVITWQATDGTEFLSGQDGFQWVEPGTPAPPAVTASGTTKLVSASFDNLNDKEVVWRYLLGVSKNGMKIQVDPEVDNDPPAG